MSIKKFVFCSLFTKIFTSKITLFCRNKKQSKKKKVQIIFFLLFELHIGVTWSNKKILGLNFFVHAQNSFKIKLASVNNTLIKLRKWTFFHSGHTVYRCGVYPGANQGPHLDSILKTR